MTPTDDDLELWSAHAGKPHAAPRGACSLAEVVAEVRRLRGMVYIGEHEFPDLTWQARALETEAEVRRLRAFEREFMDDCVVVGSEEMAEKHGRVLTERKALREENDRLRLQLERDAQAYAVMQTGMESQAELMDGLKQRVRELEKAHDRLGQAARLAVQRLEDRPTKRADVAGALREALGGKP